MTTATEPLPLPHDIAIEQGLLGSVIMGKGRDLGDLERIIGPDDFFEPLHSELFRRMSDRFAAGELVDHNLVRASLGDLGTQDVAGLTVAQYVARLLAEAVPVLMVRDYARQLRRLADQRRALAVADKIRAAVAAGDDPTELAAVALGDLDILATARADTTTARVSIAEAATQSVQRMADAYQNPERAIEIPTGLCDLDDKIAGLRRGEMFILGGRPGMGKSGLALSVLRRVAKVHPALLFSLEMGAPSLSDRIISDLCFGGAGGPIAYHDLQRGRVTEQDAERVMAAAASLRDLPFEIEQQAGLTIAQIATRARRHKSRLERHGKRLGVVAVDHLGLVASSDRYRGHRVHEIAETTGALKALAKELDVSVLCLAQLNREVENREDKRPQLSDLRDSGAIEQDADVIGLLYREAYYLERLALDDPDKEGKRLARLAEVGNLLELNIAKQRNGPVGIVQLFFDAPSNAVRDLNRQYGAARAAA